MRISSLIAISPELWSVKKLVVVLIQYKLDALGLGHAFQIGRYFFGNFLSFFGLTQNGLQASLVHVLDHIGPLLGGDGMLELQDEV